MSYHKKLKREAKQVVKIIKEFWGSDVSKICIKNISTKPFDMYQIHMIIHRQQIKMEYDRSTLAIMIKDGNEYISLSQFTNESVFKGFDSFVTENMLHNFRVLDNSMKT